MPDQKFAVITGAGTGIGRGCALALAGAGWKVAITGRRVEKLEEVAAEAPAGSILPVACDVRDPQQVEAAFAKVKAAFGRLDLLFNNAGMGTRNTLLEDLTYEQWRAVVDTNLTGPFLCTQQAFRIMKAQEPRGGRIVNNGSLSAYVPRPDSAPYTSTKHAISGLTRATALDGRKYDIACGQIDIGNAATSLSATLGTGTAQANGSMMAEPMMEVEDVGQALLYMAGLPPRANVLFMTVMATKMPFVGRG